MVFHHCFIRCFHFTTDFYYCFSGVFFVDCICSFHQLFLPWLFFIRYFVFVVLYREHYGFERAFFYSQAFFVLNSFPTFATVPQVLLIWKSFFYSQAFFTFYLSWHLAQSAFMKASLGAASTSLKAAVPPIEVRNTDRGYLFVWITQCLTKGIRR